MNNFERSLVPLLVSELEKKQSVFQVLIGPRQVGKTTIARQVMDKLGFPLSGEIAVYGRTLKNSLFLALMAA